MKIMHVIDSGGLYGAEVMLLYLAQEQLRLGLSPVIASIGDPDILEKPLEREARRTGVPVVPFRMKPGLSYHGVKKILVFCQENQINLIHSHGYKGNILLGLLPRQIRKKPILSTVHGWTSISGFSKMRLYEWLDSQCLRFADAVVLVNAAMLERPKLARLNTKGKLSVIDNGIPIQTPEIGYLKSSDRDIVDFCHNATIVGALGRYSIEKGFDILIDAFQLLKARQKKIKLLIIGDGSLKKEYQKMVAQYKIQDSVMLTGYRQNAWQYLPLMHVLAMPSRTEGLPMTLLEAMRAKVPIAASAVGGIPRVIADRKMGKVVPAENAKALAEAIESLIVQKELAKTYTKCAYQHFTSTYSSNTMAIKYQRVYAEICRKTA